MSAEDRRKWDRQVAALKEAESFERGSEKFRAAVIDSANEWRQDHDIPPLNDEFESADELGFHERAIARGIRRPIR